MWYVFTRSDNKYKWPTGRQHIHRSARSLKAEHPRSTGARLPVVLVCTLPAPRAAIWLQSGHLHHAASALYSLSRPSGRACSALGAPNRVPRSGSQTQQPAPPRARRAHPPKYRSDAGERWWLPPFAVIAFGELSFAVLDSVPRLFRKAKSSKKSLVRKSVDSDSKER